MHLIGPRKAQIRRIRQGNFPIKPFKGGISQDRWTGVDRQNGELRTVLYICRSVRYGRAGIAYQWGNRALFSTWYWGHRIKNIQIFTSQCAQKSMPCGSRSFIFESVQFRTINYTVILFLSTSYDLFPQSRLSTKSSFVQ